MVLYPLIMREKLSDKIKYGFYFVIDNVLYPGPRDFDLISLPKLALPLYFVIHQTRLIIEYIPRLIRFLLR